MKRLARHPAAQALLAALLGRYLAFALSTTRWTVLGEAHIAPVLAGQPTIAAFWHERLPLMPQLWLHARRAGLRGRGFVVVSRHNDGRFIGDIMRRFDLDLLHGSSFHKGRDRGGVAVARAMLAALGAGDLVVVTPDGPRGPRRVAAAGVAEIAARAGAAVLPCAAQIRWRVVLPSWDRMVIPLPFGRGVVACRTPIAVERGGAAAALPAIAAALSAAADQADRACR